jgi:hypothetical protein
MNGETRPWRRTVWAGALLAPLVLFPSGSFASAVPPARCALLTDPVGDATVYVGGVTPDGAGRGAVPNDGSLDITALDLYATGTNLVATMTTASLTPSNPQSPLGQYFAVAFRINGEQLVLDGVLTPLARRAWLTRADGTNVGGDTAYPAVISADFARRTVRLTASLSDVGRFAPARRGARLTAISAATQRVVGVTADNGLDARALVGVDVGTTKRTYVIGVSPRC